MTASLEVRDNGDFVIRGDLNFESVTALWQTAGELFRERSRIDLADVNRSDSAGVALLVAWLRQSNERGWRLKFVNIPPQMQAIIQVAGLSDLLPGC